MSFRILTQAGEALLTEGGDYLVTSFSLALLFDLDAPGVPANRLLLGNNLQWADQGDGVLYPTDGSTDLSKTRELALDTRRMELWRALAPSVLRYPGGSDADCFHWAQTLGGLNARTNQQRFSGAVQRPDFGVAEMMALARAVGAAVIFTVNVPSALANEARDWVKQMNVTRLTAVDGTLYGTVTYWEVGNEPYLDQAAAGRPDLDMTPAAFIAAANPIIAAMRAQDPTIKVGLPIHSDQYAAFPLGKQGYDTAVLAGLTQQVDFAAVHTGYWPILYDPAAVYTLNQLYQALMAATRATEADLTVLRGVLDANVHTKGAAFAMTEFNSFFTSTGAATDPYIATQGGAMLVADLLRMMAYRSDVLMANLWSLSGNFYFGAVNSNLAPRSFYEVLRMYGEVLRGRCLPVSAPGGATQASIQLGVIPAYSDTPTLGALVTRNGPIVRALLLNRDPVNSLTVALVPAVAQPVVSASWKTWGKNIPLWDATDRDWSWVEEDPAALGAQHPDWPDTIVVPPHGMAAATVHLYDHRRRGVRAFGGGDDHF